MQYFVFFLLLLAVLVLLTRPLTVLVHELGHAIPAMLLTGKAVSVYLGSYGDPHNSLKLKLGRMLIFFRYNPFAWRLGLCVPAANDISLNRQIIYTLTGPLASLTIGVIASYFAFAFDMHGFLKLFLIVFLVSAFFDLLINIIPNNTPVILYDGTLAYNDGHNLRTLFHYKNLPKDYLQAVSLYDKKEFSDAAVLFEKLITSGVKSEDSYRYAIVCYLMNRNYVRANELSGAFAVTGQMNPDDLVNFAISCSKMGEQEKALELYDESLRLNPENANGLNNKAYALNLMGRYEEAIPLFDKAVELDKEFAFAYNNRGLSKLKLGMQEEGLQDIRHSLTLEPDNAYAYRNLGIYHYDRAEFEKALELFLKAKEMDDTTETIDELINGALSRKH